MHISQLFMQRKEPREHRVKLQTESRLTHAALPHELVRT